MPGAHWHSRWTTVHIHNLHQHLCLAFPASRGLGDGSGRDRLGVRIRWHDSPGHPKDVLTIREPQVGTKHPHLSMQQRTHIHTEKRVNGSKG